MSVYFATCREAKAVKIGSSLDPHGRLPEIQLGCPLLLTIEAILPGSCEEEFTFHRRFADDRIRGEWFTITPMIEAIMAANPAPPPPAKAGRDPTRRRVKSEKKAAVAPVPWWVKQQMRNDRKRYEEAMAEMRANEAAA